jgi:hypothetical protein
MTIQSLKKICGNNEGQVIIVIDDKELIINNIKLCQRCFDETNNQTEPEGLELIINLFSPDYRIEMKRIL